jgi:hypothetical protein
MQDTGLSLQSTVHPEPIIAMAKLVKRARRILVVGIDLAASRSWHSSYGLMSLGFPAEGPVGGTGSIQKRVRSLSFRALLIAISFKQGLRETDSYVAPMAMLGTIPVACAYTRTARTWHSCAELTKRTARTNAGVGRRRTVEICARDERGLH